MSVPSYNDVDLPYTLDSAIRASSGSHAVHLAVAEQVTEYGRAWGLDRILPPHCRVRYDQFGDEELMGVGGARSAVESLYEGEDYVMMVDSHTRFEPDWDRALIESVKRLPSDRGLLSAVMPSNPWDHRERTPVTHCGHMDDDYGGFPSYYPTFVDSFDACYPARHAHVCSLFGRAWLDDVPYDPHIMFWGEEPTLTARLWTAGYDMYHARMPIQHGAVRPPGRPWEKPGWHDLNEVSVRRCRILLGLEVANEDDPAVREIDRYGLGTARTFDDWQAWSGFDYAAGTVVAEWGEWDYSRMLTNWEEASGS